MPDPAAPVPPPSDPFTRAQRIQVGEVDTYVAEVGAGPPIVLVHGNPDSHDVWSEVARRLAPEARCIAPDLPSWGHSIAPRDYDCSLPHQAAFIEGLFDGLGLATAHLVVHDVGGGFGLTFAALHPERVRSLTIFNTSYFPDYRWHSMGKAWRTPILGELIMLLAGRRFMIAGMLRGAPRLPRAYASRAYDAFGSRARRMVLRYYRAMTFAKVLPGWDTRLLEATRATPRQVIWGDLDPYVSAATADRFGAPVHRLADTSHWAMQESPDESARLIGALVRSTEQGSPR